MLAVTHVVAAKKKKKARSLSRRRKKIQTFVKWSNAGAPAVTI